jgi:hypothetical protein
LWTLTSSQAASATLPPSQQLDRLRPRNGGQVLLRAGSGLVAFHGRAKGVE